MKIYLYNIDNNTDDFNLIKWLVYMINKNPEKMIPYL